LQCDTVKPMEDKMWLVLSAKLVTSEAADLLSCRTLI